MTPLYHCAVCGGLLHDIFGVWVHWHRPVDLHSPVLDKSEEAGYDGDMSNREILQAEFDVQDAEARVRNAQSQLRSAKARLAKAKEAARLPVEPARDTTLQIKVQYRPGETTYTYIAYRTAQGHWLITGQRYAGKKLTWEDVIKLADKNHSGRAHLRILS